MKDKNSDEPMKAVKRPKVLKGAGTRATLPGAPIIITISVIY